MKTFRFATILILLISSFNACGQIATSTQIDSTKMYSMQEAYVGDANRQQYFLKGSSKPFTGFLYARYDNGQLESVQQFENGIGNGIWRNYDPDGKLDCQGSYINNQVEGPVKFYYEDGSVKSEGQYLHWKKPIGLWTFYDRKGKVVSKRVYTR